MKQPCSYDVSLEVIGAACPKCGHSSMVHPHIGNAVPHCPICELLEVIEEVKHASSST